ncbi:MAG TPA: FG-GAP-like repeat-containing protein, partial [Gammaproteobacteria bacterium]
MFAPFSRIVSVLACLLFFPASFAAESAGSDDPDLLWIGQPGQLTAWSLKTGEMRVQVEVSGDIESIAIDSSNGNVWLLSGHGISILDATGERIAGPAALASSEDASQLLVDGKHRIAWLVSGDRVTRWNANTLAPFDVFVAAATITDAAIDEKSGSLYVLAGGVIYRSGLFGNFSVIRIPSIKHPSLIAWDAIRQQLWVSDGSDIVVMDSAGAASGPFKTGLHKLRQLEPDSQGGVWVADNHDLLHLDSNGIMTTRVSPFAGLKGKGKGSRLRGLVPYGGGSVPLAWVYHNKLIRSVDISGWMSEPFSVPGSKAALGPTAAHVDATPPEILITQPQAETYTNNKRRPVDLVYTDYGSSVATDSLDLELDAAPLAVQCDADEHSASCTPEVDIADGYHTITATIADLAGNVSDPAEVRFSVDTVAPEIAIDAPEDHLATRRFIVTTSGALNEWAELFINDENVTLDAGYGFEQAIPLDEGENVIVYRATDRAANAANAEITVVRDTVPPEILINSPATGISINALDIRVSGSLSELAELSLNGNAIEVSSGPDFAFDIGLPLEEGENRLVLKAVDAAGNAATTVLSVTRDTTPPPAINPAAIGVSEVDENGYITIWGGPGAAEPGSVINIHEIASALGLVTTTSADGPNFTVIVNADGSFRIRLQLPPELSRVSFVLQDAAGNLSEPVEIDVTHAVSPVRIVGNTSGSLAISNSGNAIYRVPLNFPAGTAGMEPDVSLVYSSGSGDGLAGWGWTLGGFSRIARCNATYAQNGDIGSIRYDNSDRLCLDGNQLMLDSGSYFQDGAVYRPEIDDFTRITQFGSGSDSYFKAEMRNGRIAYYGKHFNGGDNHSRVARDGGNETRLWALSRIEDRSENRNYIDYQYVLDPLGRLLPESIAYTGSTKNRPYYSIDFHYGNRPSEEIRSHYRDGNAAGFRKRLNRVDLKFGNMLVKRYQLSYEPALSPVTRRSRLAAITECGKDGVGCRDPLRLEWFDAATDIVQGGARSNALWMDINGDGLDDLVFHGAPVNDGSEGPFDPTQGYRYTKLSYRLSNDNGGFEQTVDSDIDWPEFTFQTALSMDYNGDGKLDVAFRKGGVLAIAVWNDGYHADDVVETDIPNGVDEEVMALDFNGDGFTDLARNLGSTIAIHLNRYKFEGAAFSKDDYDPLDFDSTEYDPTSRSFIRRSSVVSNESIGKVSDFDGDGRQDLLVPTFLRETLCARENACMRVDRFYYQAVYSRASGDTFAMKTVNLGGDITEPMLGDVNGDGLTDIVYRNSSRVMVRLSKGFAGDNAAESFTPAKPAAIDLDDQNIMQVVLADVNFDGMQDLVFSVQAGWDSSERRLYKWQAAMSTGTTFASPGDISYDIRKENGQPVHHFAIADHNGDGLQDIVIGVFLYTNTAAGDMLESVTDSFGLETRFTYEPLHEVHEWEQQDAVEDAVRFRPRTHVVASYTSNDGAGGAFTVDYAYRGGLRDREGRGFLGFSSREVQDSRLPVEVITEYNQTFPLTGTTARETTVDSSTGKPIQRIEYKREKGEVVAGEARFQPRLLTTTEQTYAVNPASGALIKTVRSENSNFDTYGNPRKRTVVYSAADPLAGPDITVVTETEYKNVTEGRWCLGLPTKTTVKSGGLRRIEETEYENCRVDHRTVGVQSAKKLEIDYEYDGWGNIRKEIRTGSGETRETEWRWSQDNGRFRTHVINALGHTVTTHWDAILGVPEFTLDANNLKTAWEYDTLSTRIRERRADGTETVWNYAFCGASGCGVNGGLYSVVEIHQRIGAGVSGKSVAVLDALGRVIEKRQPNLNATSADWSAGWAAVRTDYDALGRVERQSMPFAYGDAAIYWNESEYDIRGRLLEQKLADGSIRKYAYNGLETVVTDPLGNKSGKRVDAKGRIRSVTDAMSNETSYHYDGFDNLTDTFAPGGSHIHVDYDLRGFKKAVSDPDMGDWSYEYNAFGELVMQTDAKGQVTSLDYDALGRLTNRDEAAGAVTWRYDDPNGDGIPDAPYIGQLYRVSQENDEGIRTYAETYQRDQFGRTINTTTGIDGTRYETGFGYDDFGRLVSVHYPESVAAIENDPPQAIAVVRAGSSGSVLLDGSPSTDDGVPGSLTYHWTQTAGPEVVISDADSATARFTPETPADYAFKLVISDSLLSDVAEVGITVQPGPPRLHALNDETPSTSYTLSWDAPTFGATANTRYELHESTDPKFNVFTPYDMTATSQPIGNRKDGQTYYYRVRACEGTICGTWSKTSTTVRLAPGAPVSFSATPASTDIGDIQLSWSRPSGLISRYVIEEARDGDWSRINQRWEVYPGEPLRLSFSRTTPDRWTYRVRAYNSRTPSTNSHATVNVTRPATLPAPVLEQKVDKLGLISISWANAGEGTLRYELRRRAGVLLETLDVGTETSYIERDAEGGRYEFQVRACKVTGCGNFSYPLSFFINRADDPREPLGITDTAEVEPAPLAAVGSSLPVIATDPEIDPEIVSRVVTEPERFSYTDYDVARAPLRSVLLPVDYAPLSLDSLPAMPVPVLLEKDSVDEALTIRWQPPSGDFTFQVLKKTQRGAARKAVWQRFEYEAGTFTHTEEDISGKHFVFRIRACNATGCGEYSPELRFPADARQRAHVDDALSPVIVTVPRIRTAKPTADDVAGTPVMTAMSPVRKFLKTATADTTETMIARVSGISEAKQGTRNSKSDSKTQTTPDGLSFTWRVLGGSTFFATGAGAETADNRFKIRYEYSTFSHLTHVREDAADGTVYWQATKSDAAGHIQREVFGNGVATVRVYSPATGLLEDIVSIDRNTRILQDLHYTWDANANLISREDWLHNLVERFEYDDLNRLDSSTLEMPGLVAEFTNLDLAYDEAG